MSAVRALCWQPFRNAKSQLRLTQSLLSLILGICVRIFCRRVSAHACVYACAYLLMACVHTDHIRRQQLVAMQPVKPTSRYISVGTEVRSAKQPRISGPLPLAWRSSFSCAVMGIICAVGSTILRPAPLRVKHTSIKVWFIASCYTYIFTRLSLHNIITSIEFFSNPSSHIVLMKRGAHLQEALLLNLNIPFESSKS